LTICIKLIENNSCKDKQDTTMTCRTIALAALLGTTATTAQAGVLTQDGVTFSSAWSGNVLTLEIDAAGRSGGWSGATGLAALAIKGVGAFTSVAVDAAPGGTANWNLSGAELKASGCAATTSGAAGSRMCFYGRQVALADDMVFQFTFDGPGVTTAEPHVKVEFVDARGNKVGSLLSQTLPAGLPPATDLPTVLPSGTDDIADAAADVGGPASVPEPRSIALLLGGLGLMGFMRRRRR
jgi:hypothetical protein